MSDRDDVGTDGENVEDYRGDYRIVREDRERGADLYHFMGPLGHIKAFEDPAKARLFADVFEVSGGFREEKTGERGAPPAVAQAGQNVQIAYYVSMPTMSVQWAAGQFGLSEEEVRDVADLIQEKATTKREESE